MTHYQLSFDFSTSIISHTKAPVRVPWRVQAISKRHSLPMAQAAFYAAEMGLPVWEVR